MHSPAPNVAAAIDQEDAWSYWRDQWSIRADTIYLNHGSFGPPPREVYQCQLAWQQQLVSQPMDFFVRQFEPAWIAARQQLADFVGTRAENLTFIENSTAAMNTVALTFPLGPEDQVLLTDHEYGAVCRIWRRACQLAGAAEPQIARLPARIESADHVVDSIFASTTPRTRLIIVSHVTSPTAIILPIKRICDEARRRAIATCVDGPHGPAQVELSLDELACDFYTASLHKWVSAPIGSGFLFVSPSWQQCLKTPVLSWGRLSPNTPTTWWDEFVWPGTRDPSAYLASGTAVDLLYRVGLPAFRARTHYLAKYARQQLVELTGLAPLTPDSDEWYGSMASVPLPPGNAAGLQQGLWQNHRIEVPIIEHNGHRSIRVSCHLYNSCSDVDTLLRCLKAELRQTG